MAERDRHYPVLSEHGASPGGFTPEYWLKRSLAQAGEHGDKYAELCAAHDLGQLYARQGERQAARGLLAAVYGSLVPGSDAPVVRQVKALLDGLKLIGLINCSRPRLSVPEVISARTADRGLCLGEALSLLAARTV